ncbi:MAG: phosphoribosylanthranilate isomerase [Promethearchaeia archaeon]
MVKYVKICGIRTASNIKTCIDYGADAIGFIYNVPSSHRNLEAHKINTLVKVVNNQILTVGVTKVKTLKEVYYMNSNIATDLLQVHGSLPLDLLSNLPLDLKKRMIIAKKITSSNLRTLQTNIKKYEDDFFGFLIDNSEGHGSMLNIRLIKQFVEGLNDAQIILAGGLSIENINQVIANLSPYGIDISSSLENENGIKKNSKIKDFLKKI